MICYCHLSDKSSYLSDVYNLQTRLRFCALADFITCLPPEKSRDIAFIPLVLKHVQRWRVSWIRSNHVKSTITGYYELTVACSPVGSMHRALRPIIAKARVRFLVKPEVFSFFFNRIGCSFYYKDHVHFHKENTGITRKALGQYQEIKTLLGQVRTKYNPSILQTTSFGIPYKLTI